MKKLVHKKKNYQEAVYALCTASIPFLGYLLFMLIPMVIALVLSFNTPKGYSLTDLTFVKFGNYNFVLHDPLFWKSVGNTFYSLLTVPIGMILGLFIAILLNQPDLKGRNIYKTIFFIPFVTSVVATSIVWKFMLDKDFGIINQFLNAIGVKSLDFLGNPKLVMPTMIALGVWNNLGFNVLLYSAALTTVDSSLYEAARMDGANRFSSFLHVTLPGVWPVTFYLLLTGLINGLQDFARFQVMLPGGGPNSSGLTIVYYLYQRGWTEIVTYGMGIASATSWILGLIILVFAGIMWFGNNKVERKLT